MVFKIELGVLRKLWLWRYQLIVSTEDHATLIWSIVLQNLWRLINWLMRSIRIDKVIFHKLLWLLLTKYGIINRVLVSWLIWVSLNRWRRLGSILTALLVSLGSRGASLATCRLLSPLLRGRSLVTGLARFRLLTSRLIIIAQWPLIIRHDSTHTITNNGTFHIEEFLLAHDFSLLRSFAASLSVFGRDLIDGHVVLFVGVDVFWATGRIISTNEVLIVKLELPRLHNISCINFLIVYKFSHIFLVNALCLENFQVVWIGEIQIVLVFTLSQILHRRQILWVLIKIDDAARKGLMTLGCGLNIHLTTRIRTNTWWQNRRNLHTLSLRKRQTLAIWSQRSVVALLGFDAG